MMPLENYLAFAIAAALLIVIPGPSVLFVVGRSIALGRRAGFFSALGNAVGTFPAVLAVAFGVGAIIAASVVAFTILKLAGAAYLIWLGVQAIRHRHDQTASPADSNTSAWTLFRQGFVVGLTNPKTIAFFVAVLPQFVAPSAGPVWPQLLALGVTFQALALSCDTAWALSAGTARAWFAKSPRRMAKMSAAGGVMIIGLGGTLALTGSRT